MSEVKRYARIGNMLEPSPGLLRLYPAMKVYVLASDYDRVAAERDALQQLLNAADERVNRLEKALKFYADGDHFLLADHDAWDTCSGEPINFLHDDAGTASVEDGSIAKAALKPAGEQ